jgi:hypothetical protein
MPRVGRFHMPMSVRIPSGSQASMTADVSGPFGVVKLFVDVDPVRVARAGDDGCGGSDSSNREDAHPIPAGDSVTEVLPKAVNESAVSQGSPPWCLRIEVVVRGVDHPGESNPCHTVAVRPGGTNRSTVPAARRNSQRRQRGDASDESSPHGLSMGGGQADLAACDRIGTSSHAGGLNGSAQHFVS